MSGGIFQKPPCQPSPALSSPRGPVKAHPSHRICAHHRLTTSACSSSPPSASSTADCRAARRAPRRSALSSASCDDTPPERHPPAPSPGRVARPTGRCCATSHQRRRGAPRPHSSAGPAPTISLTALHPCTLLQQRRPCPPPIGARRHQAYSAVAQGDGGSRATPSR